MAVLKCAVDTCSYNKSDCCCKGDIMVGGKHAENTDETCCDSFREQGRDNFVSALDHPCQTICIDCEATKCIYNANYKCHAEKVDIKGCHACDCKQTSCGTFREK